MATKNKKESTIVRTPNKKIIITITAITCVIIAFIILLNSVIIPGGKYSDAVALMNHGKYQDAIQAFTELNGYKDSINKIAECNNAILDNKYNNAITLMNDGKYQDAIQAFTELNGYKDSVNKVAECNNAILDNKYNNAITLMNDGKYRDAIQAFTELNGYKDSIDKIDECNVNIYGEEAWNRIKSINIGDTYKFGTYEQDNNTLNGKEDIEWIVLAKEETKILVISKYALDCKPYNTDSIRVTWEKCTLRKWLNSDFINIAFSDDEKAKIPLVSVTADKNPDYNTNPGNITQDKVFLLSIVEANKYFSSNIDRICKPTDYAVVNGAYVDNAEGNCWWWLRSPGSGQYNDAGGVDINGSVDTYGSYVNHSSRAVRPAMWIDISKIQ